jgi:uncharacterized protein
VDFVSLFITDFIKQLQSPTLAFLIGGMIIAALGSELVIPESICTIIVFMLLTKIGLTGGIAIRNSNLADMILPALFAAIHWPSCPRLELWMRSQLGGCLVR